MRFCWLLMQNTAWNKTCSKVTTFWEFINTAQRLIWRWSPCKGQYSCGPLEKENCRSYKQKITTVYNSSRGRKGMLLVIRWAKTWLFRAKAYFKSGSLNLTNKDAELLSTNLGNGFWQAMKRSRLQAPGDSVVWFTWHSKPNYDSLGLCKCTSSQKGVCSSFGPPLCQ